MLSSRKSVLAVLAAGLLTSACGEGAVDGGTATRPSPATPTPTVTEPTAVAPTAAEPTPAPTASATHDEGVERIAVSDGEVAGGPARIETPVGGDVTIVVSSDVADTVHLHGYDIEVPVAPGEPVTLTVTADIPGVFEIELEEAGLKIGELVVGG